MGKGKVAVLLTFVLVLSMLAGCGTSAEPVPATEESALSGGQAEPLTGGQAEPLTGGAATAGEAAAAGQGVEATATELSTAVDLASVTEDIEDHADAEAEVLENLGSTSIVLDGDSITVDGAGAMTDGGTVTITAPGTYRLAGSLDDGRVIVDVEDGVVGLVLEGVDIRNSTGPAIYVVSAQESVIVLADDTENQVSDGATRENEGAEDVPTAAIFSMADLTLSGSGSLAVDGNHQDGITSKDGLMVTGGTLVIRAQDDGIRGKDYVIVQGGDIAITAGGDGIKSDNEEDTSQGYVRIEAGTLDVTAGSDAIQAQTAVMVTDGELTLTSGGGHGSRVDASASAKGIKGLASVVIDGGTLSIDSADDAVHSNGRIVINDGILVLASGDDGVHADDSLDINGGDIRITDSYEGLESAIITINDGNIHLVASDDGINVASGNDGSGFMPGPGRGGGRGQFPGGGQQPGGFPGQDGFATGDNYLYIHGGYIVVDAHGDGLDVNGPVEMTDGVVLISGPTENMNGALDYFNQFNISGGFLVAAGSAGMAQAPSESSSQYSLLLSFDGTARAGTLVHIESAKGDQLLTFSPAKDYQTLVFSSADLKGGETYEVYLDGRSDGEVIDGLYQAGSYTSGTQYTSFTISSVVTWIGGRRR